MPAKGSKRPLVAKIVLLAVFILDELLILFINGIIGQMHIFIILIYL